MYKQLFISCDLNGNLVSYQWHCIISERQYDLFNIAKYDCNKVKINNVHLHICKNFAWIHGALTAAIKRIK